MFCRDGFHGGSAAQPVECTALSFSAPEDADDLCVCALRRLRVALEILCPFRAGGRVEHF